MVIQSAIRQVINYLFEQERKGNVSMDDYFTVIDRLDDLLQKLNQKESKW